jgi:hypothetical protein
MFVPLANNVPPVSALYQSIVSPAPGVADNSTVPVPHLEPCVTEGAIGSGFTVTNIGANVTEHPGTSVTVTLYAPDVSVVAFGIEGF